MGGAAARGSLAPASDGAVWRHRHPRRTRGRGLGLHAHSPATRRPLVARARDVHDRSRGRRDRVEAAVEARDADWRGRPAVSGRLPVQCVAAVGGGFLHRPGVGRRDHERDEPARQHGRPRRWHCRDRRDVPPGAVSVGWQSGRSAAERRLCRCRVGLSRLQLQPRVHLHGRLRQLPDWLRAGGAEPDDEADVREEPCRDSVVPGIGARHSHLRHDVRVGGPLVRGQTSQSGRCRSHVAPARRGRVERASGGARPVRDLRLPVEASPTACIASVSRMPGSVRACACWRCSCSASS